MVSFMNVNRFLHRIGIGQALVVLVSLTACAPSFSPVPLSPRSDGGVRPLYRDVQAGEEVWILLKGGDELKGAFVTTRGDSIILSDTRFSSIDRGWTSSEINSVHLDDVRYIWLEEERGMSSFMAGALTSIAVFIALAIF